MKLTICYDGSLYFGWQKTKMGPSIQEEIERAVLQITKERVHPEAASRTDRGVHAEGQVVYLILDASWESSRLLCALNAVLPKDIRVREIQPADPSFHPTLNAVQKEYRYCLSTSPVENPTNRLYAWHFRYPLDLEKMRRGAEDLLGTHDFSAFCNERDPSPICTLKSIQFHLSKEELQIAIIGDRFLYKMVRNLVGTLVYIGCGKLPSTCIPSLLASKNRRQGGITAPAHGLVLHKVFYDSDRIV